MSSPPDPAAQPGPGAPLEGSVVPQTSDPVLDRATLQGRAVRGALWTLVHVLVSVPVAFVTNVVIARLLGTADYGRLAFLSALQGTAAAILGLGSGAALIQFGAKAYAARREDEVDAMISRVQGLQLLVTLPLLTLLTVAVARLPLDLVIVLVVFGVLVPTTAGVALDCMLIENRSATSAKIAMAGNLAAQVLAVGAALALRSGDAVWAARLAVEGMAVLASIAVIRPRHRRAVLRPRRPTGLGRPFWRFALLSMVGGVVAGLVMSRSEVFVLQWLGSAEDVGLFALAFGLSAHVFAPAMALIGPLTPALAALHEVESVDIVRQAFLRTMRTASTVSGGAVAVLVAPVGLLVPLVYGREYADASPFVIAFGAIGATTMLTAPVSAFVLARLSAGPALRANLLALGVDLAAAVILIPGVGIWGAVVANALGALSLLVLLLRMEVKQQSVGARELVRVLSPALVGGVASVTAYVAAAQVGTPLWAAGVSATLGLALYLALIRLTGVGLTSGDALALDHALPRTISRLARHGLGLLVTERTA